MQFDFSKPQRQSSACIIIMTGYTLQKVIRALIFPLIIFLVKAKFDVILYLVLASVFLVLISIIYAYYYFLKFTFYLDNNKQEFVINKGVFGRTMLTFPLEKIQQVNINQNILQKIVGVYSVHIDTAGTDAKEATINAVKHEMAYALKEHLLNGKTIVPEKNVSVDEVDQSHKIQSKSAILTISPATLFKVGLTSNYASSFALLLGFAYVVFHNFKEFLKAFYTDKGQLEDFISRGLNVASIGIVIGILLIVLLFTNIARTFVKYFNFQISKYQQSLLISAGLFTRKDTLLNPNKVQVTAYSQNFFQRKMQLFNLILKQAHAGEQNQEKEAQNNNLDIPGCHPNEKDFLLKMILGKLPTGGEIFLPNWRFVNLPIVFKALLPFLSFMGFYLNFKEVQPYLPLAIAYLVIAVMMIYISYSKHQLKVNHDFIIKRSGIWDISHEIIEPHKIQAISTFQYPWHKSIDVGHVNLHTAAGTISYKFGNYTEIKKLVNFWLYQIESDQKDWM